MKLPKVGQYYLFTLHSPKKDIIKIVKIERHTTTECSIYYTYLNDTLEYYLPRNYFNEYSKLLTKNELKIFLNEQMIQEIIE